MTIEQFPITDMGPDLLAAMREKLWTYSASVFGLGCNGPYYAGTATCLATAAQEYLLTAAHVWLALTGGRFALSLESDRLLVPLRKDCVEPMTLHSRQDIEWGPDLALLKLPDLVACDIRQVNAFYNVDKHAVDASPAPRYDVGVWAVIGAPAEQSQFAQREAVLKITLFASVVRSAQERDGFDSVDLSYYHEGRTELPSSYGGISGAGLWNLPVAKSETGAITWNGRATLKGVAFYQQAASQREGTIRCHGRKSVCGSYNMAPNQAFHPTPAAVMKGRRG